jgi:ATP-dependent RNA helicase RhlE
MNERSEGPAQSAGDASSASSSVSPKARGVFTELIPELQRALAAEGYTEPTPIQEQSIRPLLEGRDLMGCAQTGTGKTAAFALPLLQHLSRCKKRPQKGMPRALVLAPTRELAGQIGDSFKAYGKFLKVSYTVVFGGVSQNPQVDALNRGVDILVATPGRLLDLMQQGHVHLNEVTITVLDEVDRMLDMGFIPDVQRILSKVPKEHQAAFFSATMPAKISHLIQGMSRTPVSVSVAPEEPTLDSINQRVLFVQKADKDKLLVRLLKDSNAGKVIVFTQMKYVASRLSKKLKSAGINSVAIHGDKNQKARTHALEGFKKGLYQVLVATDVAARGLDVDDVTHVINYDIPVEPETYVHRIGRTARAGASGDAISLCCSDDGGHLRQIDLLLGEEVPSDHEHEFHCDRAKISRKPVRRTFRPRGGRGRRRR